jgi:ferredoxin
LAKIYFKNEGISADVEDNTKILKAAIDQSVNLNYVCSAARCGTCVVLINSEMGEVSPIGPNEQTLLESLGVSNNPKARLACQCKAVSGTVVVDTSIQE